MCEIVKRKLGEEVKNKKKILYRKFNDLSMGGNRDL